MDAFGSVTVILFLMTKTPAEMPVFAELMELSTLIFHRVERTLVGTFHEADPVFKVSLMRV